MALKPADMESCDPKKKCLQGVNAGIAYTPGDECESGYTFNLANCDCESTAGTYRYDGTIAHPNNSLTSVTKTFTIALGDQFGIISDVEASTTFIPVPNTFIDGNTSIVVTRSDVPCSGGGVAFFVRVNYAGGGGINHLLGTGNINCAYPQGAQVSITGTFTKIS